jgi:O-methyltransferase involved in polyketide biosynthesis
MNIVVERRSTPMNAKEKVSLTKEQETLLIPLYAKAQDNPLFNDEKAQQILASVEYDFQQLKVPQKTAVMLQIRAKQLDAYTRQFITAHPNALILHLGCGLDSRCERLARAGSTWTCQTLSSYAINSIPRRRPTT